jgi:hypothetical protein
MITVLEQISSFFGPTAPRERLLGSIVLGTKKVLNLMVPQAMETVM